MRLPQHVFALAVCAALVPESIARADEAPAASASPSIAIAAAPAATAPVATPPRETTTAPAAARIVLVDELPYREGTRSGASKHAARAAKKRGRHGRPYHPAPGIVVDVTDAQGALAAADMQRKARNDGYWPLRRCYEEGLRRNQKDGGRVSLDITVGPSGAIDRASVAASTISDESVTLCVAREASHLSFEPAFGATTAKMAVGLSTGDEPVRVQRAIPHASDVREALRASWPAVQQCYASELVKHPGAGGRLELKFRAKRTGEIEEVSEADTRFASIDVTRCVLGVYRATKLPAVVHGPRDSAFVYALHFESKAP